MKRDLFAFVAAAILMLISTPVQAATFSLTPQGSAEAGNVGDIVTFDLSMTTDAGEYLYYNFWVLDFTYDPGEIAFDDATFDRGMGSFFIQDDGQGNLRLTAALPFSGPDLEAAPNQTYDVASISFTVTSVQDPDGLPDLSLASQVGTTGCDERGLYDEFTQVSQFDGAQAADIGGFQPVPGIFPLALLLLGATLAAGGVNRIRRQPRINPQA